MTPRTASPVIVLATFVVWMGSRATAIALPLVALQHTGQVWSIGLVMGAQAVPLISLPWWGACLRGRIRSGRDAAVVMVAKAAGLAIIPITGAVASITVATLIVCGLVVGATSALEGPAVRSLLADVGDRIGPGHAARSLALQDLAHRSTMFVAPPLAAWAVGNGHTWALLWSESCAVLVAACLVALVPATLQRNDATMDRRGSSMGDVLHRHPRVRASVLVHSATTLSWFAFSLGLTVVGVTSGHPGAHLAAGMAGYGVASTLTSLMTPWLVNRLPEWPTAVLPAMALGAVFSLLPSCFHSLAGVAALAAVGGVAMPVGIAAHNRILATDPAPGPERQAAFTVDQVLSGGLSAIGMLGGGALIGLFGPSATLVGAGVALMATALAAFRVRLS